MQDVYVAFRNFCGIVGNISKKTYRNCVVLLTGAAVVALISFNSKEFGGSGKNKTTTLTISNFSKIVKEEEGTEEEQTLQMEESTGISLGDTENSNIENTEKLYQPEEGEIDSLQVQCDSVKEIQSAEQMKAAMEAEQRNYVASRNVSECFEKENKDYFAENQEKDNCVETPTAAPTLSPTPVPKTERMVQLDDRNYQVLLRIVEAEAGGESLEGKKLVANVILNRVAHEKFPDTVEEVVFQRTNGKVQFSPTADGRFDSVVISQDTIDAVEAVLCGENNSQGALFFSARSKADPSNMSWFDTHLKWLFACGGHEFYTLP